jgi:hypothetical protein
MHAPGCISEKIRCKFYLRHQRRYRQFQFYVTEALKMNCNRCGASIPDGDETLFHGQLLCADCYMHMLSPARACDPWAVRSAQALSQSSDSFSGLSDTQASILMVLSETGGLEPIVIAQRLRIKLSVLERELATLRHMEKIRGQIRSGKKVVCLWDG